MPQWTLCNSNTVPAVNLIRRIHGGDGEFLLFALTPPRLATDHERAQEIADATVARLRPLGLDGLILYDIDDETQRNPAERPFPFMPTLDPADYLANHLGTWHTPVIVYRAVSKYAPAELRNWLSAQDPERMMTVLVGAPSSSATVRTSLRDAQAIRREVNPGLLLGGVAIPERHARREDEHLRLLAKQDAGCRFFVSQVEQIDAPILALIKRGRRAGAFRKDLPTTWLLATYYALMHAAADEVNGGRLGNREALTALKRTIGAAFHGD